MKIKNELVNQVVLPGDVISAQEQVIGEDQNVIRIGPGLMPNESDQIVCNKPGVLRFIAKQNKYFVETFQNRVIFFYNLIFFMMCN